MRKKSTKEKVKDFFVENKLMLISIVGGAILGVLLGYLVGNMGIFMLALSSGLGLLGHHVDTKNNY